MKLANLKTRFVTLLKQRLGFSRTTSFSTMPRGWHMLSASIPAIALGYFARPIADIAHEFDQAAHADPSNWLAWVGFAVLFIIVIWLLSIALIGAASLKVLVDSIIDEPMRKPRFRIARKEKTSLAQTRARRQTRV